jgi:hypothetical protein
MIILAGLMCGTVMLTLPSESPECQEYVITTSKACRLEVRESDALVVLNFPEGGGYKLFPGDSFILQFRNGAWRKPIANCSGTPTS